MSTVTAQIEEIANAGSHGLGIVLAVLVWPVLAGPLIRPDAGDLQQAGDTVFVFTMLLMFLISAAFHASPVGPGRRRLQRLDHATIYLFIAGSCTPFALAGLEAGVGAEQTWPMLVAVWATALVGMTLKLFDRLRRPLSSTLLYLAFGWLAAAAALPALRAMEALQFTLVLAGGLAYSIGAAIYLLSPRLRFGHFVWHLLVMAGCGFHLLALWQRVG